MERLFETVVSLAEEARCLRSGMPEPLDLALFVREFRREVRAPFPPPLASAPRSRRSPGWPSAAAATCSRAELTPPFA
jgi:hypothetical protein